MVAYTVKQVAERVGLPRRTVRYYDTIGLISPKARSDAGYRLYSPEEEGKLRFLCQAKALGLSLGEIRELLAVAERGCCGEVLPELDRLLGEKVAGLDARIVELRSFREQLVAYRAGKRNGGCACGCGSKGSGAFCGCLSDASPLQISTQATMKLEASAG